MTPEELDALHERQAKADAQTTGRPSRWSGFFVGYCCATFIHIVTCVSPHQAIDNLNKWFSP